MTIPTCEYLVYKILPAYELHLLGGPSGAGKTRLVFQIYRQWCQEHRFLEWETNGPPPETMYLAFDRSTASIAETMADFPGLKIPWASCRNQNINILRLPELYPKVKLFIIDGIATQLESGKTQDYTRVSEYVRSLGKMCEIHKITIIGLMHSPKTKKNEGYENPRQRLHGSVAWAAFGESVFLFEPKEAKNPANTERRLFVCPRNAPECFLDYKFNKQGNLDPVTPEDDTIALLLTLIPFEEPGIGRKDLMHSLESELKLPIIERSFDRIIQNLKTQGSIRSSKTRNYIQVRPS